MSALCKKLCRECPFSRQSAPGYLGELSYQPEAFLASFWGGMVVNGFLSSDAPLPCHMTVDWEVKGPTLESPICRGAATFMRNCAKSSRHPDMRAAIDAVSPDRERVFATPQEFIRHHKATAAA